MRVSPSPPPLCTGCGLAKPHDTFVDFEVAYDGPVFELEGAKGFIYELHLCESCVRTSAELLELAVQPTRELELERDRALAEATRWREYAEGLEETYGRRPEPLKRPVGRPPRTAPRPESEAVAA